MTHEPPYPPPPPSMHEHSYSYAGIVYHSVQGHSRTIRYYEDKMICTCLDTQYINKREDEYSYDRPQGTPK